MTRVASFSRAIERNRANRMSRVMDGNEMYTTYGLIAFIIYKTFGTMGLLLLFCIALTGTAVSAQEHPATVKEAYPLSPDSEPQAGVPEGKITEFTLPDSKNFPGFEHK